MSRSINRENILIISICVFTFTIPISSFVSVRLLFALLVFSFFLKGLNRFTFYRTWDILFYVLVLLVGLLYSKDVGTGLKVLETNFSWLAVPLLICRLDFKNVQIRDAILKSFILGVLVTSILCLITAIYRFTIDRNIQVFFFETFTEVIKFHPTYLAYYIILSISIELYFLYHSEYNGPLIVQLGIVIFLFVVLILTGGQTAFISLLFIFSFFILKFLTEERSNDTKAVLTSIFLMLACMFTISLAGRDYRFLELNDSWERFSLWKATIDAIPNLFTGVGTGDYKSVLNEYYLSHGLGQYAADSYNSHNQFIQILLTNGISGLLAVLLLICRPLYLAVKNQHALGVLVFFPFLLYGVTEVFLGRYQGIVFFALLHQVFVSYYAYSKTGIVSLKGA